MRVGLFAGVIRCTSGSDKVGSKIRSKWSRALLAARSWPAIGAIAASPAAIISRYASVIAASLDWTNHTVAFTRRLAALWAKV
jgi:hypothetical protein